MEMALGVRDTATEEGLVKKSTRVPREGHQSLGQGSWRKMRVFGLDELSWPCLGNVQRGRQGLE